MPDAKFRTEENMRPPLLNGLIIVTLATIVVALGYLAGYYLSAGSERKPTWFAPQMMCHLPAQACTARLGRFGSMRFALHRENALPSATFDVDVEGIMADTVDMVLEGRTRYSGTEHIVLLAQGDGRFVGTGQLDLCAFSPMYWRAKVIAHTPKGQLGSWFDFRLPCAPSR